MKSTKIAVLTAVALALAPAFAMAASLDVGSTLTTGVSAGTGTSTSVQVDIGADANTGTSANAGSASSTSGSMAAMDMSGVTTGTNGMLMITAGDTGSAAGADTTNSGSITSSSMVNTDADFASYAQSQIQGDANIKEVDADNSSVAVKYAEPAQLFGIFPVTMDATAKVTADGNVTFSYPWYSFLASSSTNDAALRAAIAAQAASTLNTEPSQASEGATSTVAADVTLTASQKAKLLDGIRLALANAMNANATASTTAGY